MTTPGGEEQMLKQEGSKQVATLEAPSLQVEGLNNDAEPDTVDMDQPLLTPAPPTLQQQVTNILT